MMNPSSVLVIGRDPLLLQVLRHLLPQPTPVLVTADNIDEALAHKGQTPRFAVVELPPGEEAASLLFELRGHLGPVPLIVLTPDPALPALPPEWEPAPHVLSQPPDLSALRKAIEEIWDQTEGAAPKRSSRFLQIWGFTLGLTVACIGLLLVLPILGVPYMPNLLKLVVARPQAASQPPATTIHLIEGAPDTFRLEEDAALAMRIPRPFRISENPAKRQMTLAGSLAFDPDRLGRVQSRFQGEVISIGLSREPSTDSSGQTIKDAPLRYGNRVEKGQLMAVVWSKDLGEKKSELVDWLVKLSLDEENLARLEDLWRSGAGTEANYRAAKNAVSADLNGVARARRTLEIWRVEDKEIKEIEKEAKRIISSRNLRDLEGIKSNLAKWARVEIFAPFDGIIVEKSVAIGSIVDPTIDLFRVADMRKLAVFANAYEEDQRVLQNMQAILRPAPIPWRVFLTSDPEKTPLASDGIEKIGYIVDPQQRTNLVIGKVDNKDGRLRVGQSATAVVDLTPPPGVVSIPASALVEDGADSVVFVQPDPKKLVYVMKRVVVVERFNITVVDTKQKKEPAPEQWAYVRSVLDEKEKKAGLSALQAGDWVLASAVVELKAALEEVQARDRREKEERENVQRARERGETARGGER